MRTYRNGSREINLWRRARLAAQVLNALAKHIPNIMGGSADLNPSTNTALKGEGDFQPTEFGGPAAQGAVGGAGAMAGATWRSAFASTPWARR